MSGKKCNSWFEVRLRNICMVASLAAAVVLFMWARARAQEERDRGQDGELGGQAIAIAIVETKVDALRAEVRDIKTTVERIDAKLDKARDGVPAKRGGPQIVQAEGDECR